LIPAAAENAEKILKKNTRKQFSCLRAKKLLNTDYADDTDRRGFLLFALSVLIRTIRVIRVQKKVLELYFELCFLINYNNS